MLGDEPRQAQEIVSGAGEDEDPVHLMQTAQLDLPNRAGLLEPSEALLDQPSPAQADRVAGMPGGSAIHVRAASLLVLRYMRGHVERPGGGDEVLGVVSLVGTDGDTPQAAFLLRFQQQQSGFALGIAIGLGGHRGGDQAVTVLHQRMAEIGQMRLLAVALLVEPGVRIGGRSMGLVRALLTVEVRAVAIGAVLLTEALLRCPGLDQRPIDGEVLIAHEALRLVVDLGKELLRHLAGEQSVAVLRKHGVIPHRVIHAEADEPAEQQVVIKLFNQLPLRAHRVKRLQQKRPKHILRRNRGTSRGRVHLIERRAQRGQNHIREPAYLAQRMILRNTLLQRHVAEHPTLQPLVSTHTPYTITIANQTKSGTYFNKLLTFNGLKQVLYEPQARVYIGEVPPNLKNDYQVIDSVLISNSPDWFGQVELLLNPNLVSVIGPRGSGKSALAELIALAGGSNLFRDAGDTKDTFLAKASKRSPSSTATVIGTQVLLKWRDQHESNAKIEVGLKTSRPEEEVKYLPQKFVERLCAPENNNELECEIERVIYQRHQKGAQSDASNFQELRRAATQAIETRRQRLAQNIKTLNQSIASRGLQIDQVPAKQADLSRKKTELDAVIKLAPIIPEANKADIASLNSLETKRKTLTESLSRLNRQLALLDTIAARYEIITADILQFNRDMNELFAEAGVTNFGDCLPVVPPLRAGEVLTERRQQIMLSITTLQGADDETDLTISGIDKLSAVVKTKLTMTEAKQKEYEKNQADKQKLESTIAALERDIKEINDVVKPKRTAESQERMEAFLDALDLLSKETEVLQKLYQPLHDALANSNETAQRLGFISKVVFNTAGKATRGMELFDRRKSTIKDEEELRAHLSRFFEDIANAHFDRTATQNAFEALLKTVVGVTPLKDQLRKENTPRDFADWLFDTDPYSVAYSLEYDNKDLKFLSPGEKGIVLLLLYLEAEEDDHRPLIIDQPDDNLDNLSIYPNLVQYFRDRKLTRQIIIITHNPNLVVTTDAEQIIVGNFDGSQSPKIRYRSGSLENTNAGITTGIKEEVCRVLEGGVTAFQIRENRYAFDPE